MDQNNSGGGGDSIEGSQEDYLDNGEKFDHLRGLRQARALSSEDDNESPYKK